MNHKKNSRLALIATLPKSGTWYSHTFFWCYEQLLKNSEAYLAGNFKLDLAAALKKRAIHNETSHIDTLQIDRMFICHTICPGYYELNDIYNNRWQALNFPITGFNWGENYTRSKDAWEMLSPFVNPEVKIVYLYRNPLDHFVSYFYHGQVHLDDEHRFKNLKDGNRFAITDLHSYIFYFGALSAFIKHYYTYLAMHRHFPNNILMVAYENLTSSPENTFYKILAFLNAEPNNREKYHLFKEALSACSKESLMKIENEHNLSLANDLVKGNRHIRGGKIGKWKEHLSKTELESIEMALNSFDFSLRDFTLEPNKRSEDLLPWLLDFSSKKHLSEFFINQFDDWGTTVSWVTKEVEKITKSSSKDSFYENNKNLINWTKDLQLQFNQIRSDVLSLLSSKSWQATYPLRFAANLYRKILNK